MKKFRTLRALDDAELIRVHGCTESDSPEAVQPQTSHSRPLTGIDYTTTGEDALGNQMRPR